MFFNYLSQIMSSGVDYHLTISKTAGDKLVVVLTPKMNGLKDPAQNRIMPLHLVGTPQELDHGFFPAVTTPIQKAAGLLSNMAEYEKNLEAAAKESKAAKDKKDEESKAERAKKEKYNGFVKKADELEAAGNLDGAITQLQQARLHATDKTTKTVDDKIAALRKKMSQGSLFEVDSAMSAQPATPASAPIPAPEAPIPTPAPANVAGFDMFGMQTQPQPQQAPQPQTQAPPVFDAAASGRPTMGAPVFRPGEYDGIEDFPKEMLPPTYPAKVA